LGGRSYKAGHALDVNLVRQLDWHDLIVPFVPQAPP